MQQTREATSKHHCKGYAARDDEHQLPGRWEDQGWPIRRYFIVQHPNVVDYVLGWVTLRLYRRDACRKVEHSLNAVEVRHDAVVATSHSPVLIHPRDRQRDALEGRQQRYVRRK